MRSGGECTKGGYLCCVVIQCERDQVGQCQPRQRIQRASTRERKRQGHSACVPLVRVLASGRVRCRPHAAAGRRRRVAGRRRRVGGGCSFFVALQSIPSAVSSQHPSPVTSHRPAPTTHYHPPPPITHSPPHSIGRNKICTFWQTTSPQFPFHVEHVCYKEAMMPKVKRYPYTKAGKAAAKKARKKKKRAS